MVHAMTTVSIVALTGSLFSLISMWQLHRKNWWGWVINVASNIFFLYVDIAVGLWSMVPICVVMLYMGVRSAVTWYTENKRLSRGGDNRIRGRDLRGAGVHVCTRPAPHVCTVSGPCNG